MRSGIWLMVLWLSAWMTEVFDEGRRNPLERELGLSLGKPAANPACPELGQLDIDGLDDGDVAGGVEELLGPVDSWLGGRN